MASNNKAGNTPATTPTPNKAAAPVAPAAAPVAPATAPVLPTLAGKVPTVLAKGQQAVANGCTFAAPVAGSYTASGSNAGWPTMPTGSAGYAVPGTYNAPGQPPAPCTVLVLPKAKVAGQCKRGAVAGAYQCWPYHGPNMLHLPQQGQ